MGQTLIENTFIF